MRIYTDCRELMSEMGRELIEMGHINKPKTYQNKNIEGDESFITRELIAESYCLTSLDNDSYLFAYTKTKDWAKAEFKERISGKSINPGKAWELNKSMWEEFLVENPFYNCPSQHPMSGIEKIFDYTYSERMSNIVCGHKYNNKTYLEAIIQLLKDDNDTRKAVLSIFDADKDIHKLDGWARIPCSMYYQFLIRDTNNGKQCNIVYNQRSADFVGHFGDDVWLAWKLMEYVAENVGVKPGYLFHQLGSLHSYKRDWWKLKTSIDELV